MRIGVSDWMPYQYLSESGEASGKQVELIKQISAKAGCSLSFVSTKFVDGLTMLQDGTLDLQMNASVSDERAEYSWFSIPYRKEFLLLYSTPKFRKQCQTQPLKQLIKEGFKLGLQYGLVYGEEITEIQNDPQLNKQIVYSSDNVQHVALVQKNGLDGIVDDPIVVSYRNAYTSGQAPLKSCPIVVSAAPVSLIFSKKSVNKDIVDKYNRAIKDIQETRQYQKNWSW